MHFDFRWKLGLLLGGVLTVFLCFYGVVEFLGIHQRFNLNQLQRSADYDRQFYQLVEQKIIRYQQYLSEKIAQPHWQQALINADLPTISSNVERLSDQNKILDSWLSVVLYDQNSNVLVKVGEETPDDWLVKQTQHDSKPNWYSDCREQCRLWIAIPALDNRKTVVSFSINLNPLILNFEDLSLVHTFLLLYKPDVPLKPPDNESGNTRIEKIGKVLSWNDSIDLVSYEKDKIGLLDRIAYSYPFEDLENGVIYKDKNNRYFWVKLYPFNAVIADKAQQYILYLYEITGDYNQQVFLALQYLIFGLCLWMFLLPLLLFILWRPIENLRRLIEVMSFARTEVSDDLRKKVLDLRKTNFLVAETKQLISSVLMLVDQRIFVQRLLQQRTDLLEERRNELESEREFVNSLLDTAQSLIVIQSSHGKIELINRYGAKLIGKSEAELADTCFAKLLPYHDDLPDTRFQLNELTKGLRKKFTHESEFIRHDGKRIFMVFYHSSLPKKDSYGHQVLTIALDISQRKHVEEYLSWLAKHDALTGLINRRHFVDELEKVLKYNLRYRQHGAVLCFNIDQFKDVNDTSGYSVGDDLLKSVARVLRKHAREFDITARLGGDEFAMLLPRSDELEAAETAERLCKALNKIMVRGENGLHYVSASIGVVIFPDQVKSTAELFANADMAMMQAKDAGRNGWKLFKDDDKTRLRVSERVYWNEMVKRTLENDSFEMYYQPIQNLRTKTVSHHEALLRIFDDKNQILSSQKFILSAENSGSIQELDLRIMSKVFRDKAILEKAGILTKLSMNLSALSFKNDSLIPHIDALYQSYKIERSGMIFEITETAAVSDAQRTLEIMSKIKKDGFQFSLDDFGVGFSSLYYLKKFPFDYVKIDGSFVRNLTDNADDQVLIKALVEVVKSFGLVSIAEFVETGECWELLKSLNVDYAQGYFIGKPIPPELIWPQLYEKSVDVVRKS